MALHRTGRSRLIAGLIAGVLGLTAACSGSTGGLPDVQSAGVSPAGAAAVPPASAGGVTVPGGPSTDGVTGPGTSVATTTAPPPPVAKVAGSPAFGAGEISPTAPVTISVSQGPSPTSPSPTPRARRSTAPCRADKTSWTLGRAARLRPHLHGHRDRDRHRRQAGADHRHATRRSHPVDEITTSISPGDDAVVGVAAPVIVYFGYEPADKAAVEKHVTITTTPEVEGAWAWITARRRPVAVAGLAAQGLLAGRHPGPRRVATAVRASNFGGGQLRRRQTSPATSPSAATRSCWPTPTRTTSWSSRTASPSPPTTPPTAAATTSATRTGSPAPASTS